MFLASLSTVWKWVKSGDNPAPYSGITTKSAINQALNTAETLNFTSGMVRGDLIGIVFKIIQWAWHRPLLGESPYLGIFLTDFNLIWYITFLSYFYVIVRNRITTMPISHITPFYIPSDSFTFHYAKQATMIVSGQNFAWIMRLKYATLSTP